MALGDSSTVSQRDEMDLKPLPDLKAVKKLPLSTLWLENLWLDPVLSW